MYNTFLSFQQLLRILVWFVFEGSCDAQTASDGSNRRAEEETGVSSGEGGEGRCHRRHHHRYKLSSRGSWNLIFSCLPFPLISAFMWLQLLFDTKATPSSSLQLKKIRARTIQALIMHLLSWILLQIIFLSTSFASFQQTSTCFFFPLVVFILSPHLLSAVFSS